jgi:hypothetical protein
MGVRAVEKLTALVDREMGGIGMVHTHKHTRTALTARSASNTTPHTHESKIDVSSACRRAEAADAAAALRRHLETDRPLGIVRA